MATRGQEHGRGFRVGIVGGGLGGVTAALALHHQGVQVDVYEQAPALAEVGAGVHLSPNSLRVLDTLGLHDRLWARGTTGESLAELCRTDGTHVFPAIGVGGLGLHRADLLDVLVDALPDGIVHTDHRVSATHAGRDSVTLDFDGYESVTADVVIAADGIKSVSRSSVLAEDPRESSGYLVYRGVIERTAASRWPLDLHRIWMGHGRHLVTFPVRGTELLTYVAFIPLTEPLADPEKPEEVRELLAGLFRGWDPMIQDIVADIGAGLRLEVADMRPLDRWIHGRLALLGDSAHAMQPHLAQGANQAIEDAGVLALLLGEAAPDTVDDALERYERIRRPRTTLVQQMSRRQGIFYDTNGWYPELLGTESLTRDAFYSWLYDYDFRAAVQS